MNRKIGVTILVFVLVSIFATVLIKNKIEHNYNFQYIGYFDEDNAGQYSAIQDFYYFRDTGILIIKAASDQISINSIDDFIEISFLNKIETIKTHVILLNKQEKAKYNGIEVTKQIHY